MKLCLAVVVLLMSVAHAGNGVERGSIDVIGLDGHRKEIINFLKRKLVKCAFSAHEKNFVVLDTQEELVRVVDTDDRIYRIHLQQVDDYGAPINDLIVNVMDADLDLYRTYEEKLSFHVVKDEKQACRSSKNPQ